MFWKYSRSETKQLLNATLIVFASFAIFVGHSWNISLEQERGLTANTVGVMAGVEDNGINTLAVKLDDRERELDARELALTNSNGSSDRKLLLGVMVLGASLFGLIMLNFYLDSKRRMSLVE
jgi:hypothetical protein